MRAVSLTIFLAASVHVNATETTIRAARVVDGHSALRRNVAVVVDGSKIVRIEKQAGHVDYDLGNRTLMPGGIDTHVHVRWHFDANGRSSEGENESPEEKTLYAAENAYVLLMGGITTLQSLGAPVDKPMRDAIARGVLPGPRILMAIDPIGAVFCAATLKPTVDIMAGVDEMIPRGTVMLLVLPLQPRFIP